MKKSLVGALFLLLLYTYSCSKASEDSLQSTCDTTDVQYQADVLPIISGNCYSCHGNGNTSGGVNLDGYNNLKVYADNGDLLGVINHSPGYPPMPEGGAKLSDCNIAIITAWVAAGAPNN